MTRLTIVAAFFVLSAGVLFSSRAAASPTYPGELQALLDMPCVPQCTLCHRDNNGGRGTVVTPFGQAMRQAGLVYKRPDLIQPALDKLQQEGVDSDGDGVGDVDELRQGRNPNQPGEGVLCVKYGCGASVAPDANAGIENVAAVALALCFAIFMAGRTRQRK